MYTCRILAEDESAASRSCEQMKGDESCSEMVVDNKQECMNSVATASRTDTVPPSETSVSAVGECIVSAADCNHGEAYQFNSNKSDKVDSKTSAVEDRCHRDELLTAADVNRTVSTACEPHHTTDTGSGTVHHEAEMAEVCSDSSRQCTSSFNTGDVDIFTRCEKLSSSPSKQRHRDRPDNSAADAAGKSNSSARLFHPNLPAFECVQNRSFADESDNVDVGIDTAAESNVCPSRLRSDFDRHAQLNCAPLKLISQLDGAVPDSESEASDDEASVKASCVVILSGTLATPFRRQFATDQGVPSPFKCVKCRRVYRTRESCELHSTVCMFEVSSSSESEDPDCDEAEVVDPSDEETDSCCSDEGDDGMISDYLTRSHNSETAANCSSLGCQTGDSLEALEVCDVNANCKMLCDSNVETWPFGLRAVEESSSVTNKLDNKVGGESCDLFTKSCENTLHSFQNVLVETSVTPSLFRVTKAEEMPCDSTGPTAVDISVPIDENIHSGLQSDAVASYGQLTQSGFLRHGNIACCSKDTACELLESQTTSEFHAKSVPCCDSTVEHLEAACGAADASKGMHRTLLETESYSGDVHLHSNHSESQTAESDVTAGQEMTCWSGEVFNVASLAGQQQSPLLVTSKASREAVVSTNYDTVDDFSRTTFTSCVNMYLHGDQNAALGSLSSNANASFPWKIGHVASSPSVCVPSQQYALKPQDMLTSSASMVWPSATVSPSIVNNNGSLSATSSGGICTQLLAAPWLPLGVLTTASIVIPTALPNAAAAAWIRPLNIAQPLFAAVRPSEIQSGSFGRPVQLLQQFMRPALVAPVAWLAPQLAMMNAAGLRRPMTVLPAVTVTSACSSPRMSSQQSLPSMFATANVLSASHRPVLTHCRDTAADHGSLILQKAVISTATFTIKMTQSCPQDSSFTLPLVASVPLPLESAQTASQPALARQQYLNYLHQLGFAAALSHHNSVPPSPVSRPSLYSLSCGSPSVSLMDHITSAAAAPLTLSKDYGSCGSTSFTWSTGTTPINVSSLSNSSYDRKENFPPSFSKENFLTSFSVPVSTYRINADVGIAVDRWSSLSREAPRFSGLLNVHTDSDTRRAYCPNLIASQSTSMGNLLLSTAADVLKSQPVFIPSSDLPVSVSTVRMSPGSHLPVVGNSVKSPRLIIQPSSLAVTTESPVLMNLARPYTTARLPDVRTGNSTPGVPASCVAPARSRTFDTEPVVSNLSPAASQLAGTINISSRSCYNMPVNRPLPWSLTSVGCLSDSVYDQQISPVNDKLTKCSAGKYNSVLYVDG